MSSERFHIVDQDSPKDELRFDCCPTPIPIVYQDQDDKKAWEVMCESCSMTICYLTAPDESAMLIGPEQTDR